MKQIFYHYLEWEDYKNGMYRTIPKELNSNYINAARNLLINPEQLYDAMHRVLIEWPVSTAQNLTNSDSNSKAWLGQAACCINHRIPEDLTRAAWNTLTQKQMNIANKVADNIISLWIKTKTKNGIQKDLFEYQCA